MSLAASVKSCLHRPVVVSLRMNRKRREPELFVAIVVAYIADVKSSVTAKVLHTHPASGIAGMLLPEMTLDPPIRLEIDYHVLHVPE